MRSKRAIRLTVIGAIVLAAFLCAFVYFGLLRAPKPSGKQISVSVDNSYRNYTRNLWEDAAGGEDKIYFCAYNRFFFSDGIYQIDSSLTRRVYRAPISITSPYIPFSSYCYRGKLVTVQDGAICCLNMGNGRFEPFLDPPMKDGETLSDLFTAGGELYYTTVVTTVDEETNDDLIYDVVPLGEDTYTIYHYVDDDTVDIAASETLCGEGFFPYDYCGGKMYYFSEGLDSEKPVPNDFHADLYDIGQRRLYEYDLATRKTTRCFDFSCLDNALPDRSCALDDLLVAGDQVYLIVKKLECLEDHYSPEIIEHDAMLQDIGYAEKMLIFRYDIRSDSLEKLMEIDDCNLTVNGCGDTVYMKTVSEDYSGSAGTLVDRLYAFRADSVEPAVLHTGKSIKSLYIFDEEWLYYSTDDSHLYRIRPDDNKNELVV